MQARQQKYDAGACREAPALLGAWQRRAGAAVVSGQFISGQFRMARS